MFGFKMFLELLYWKGYRIVAAWITCCAKCKYYLSVEDCCGHPNGNTDEFIQYPFGLIPEWCPLPAKKGE